MLRATPISDNESSTLKLEGKLCGLWVEEVQHCWQEFVHDHKGATIHVNLQEVVYLDGLGRDLLLRMEREGASLVGCSEFIRHLLRQEKPDSKRQDTTFKEE
jgi:hypothetical protein